MHDRRFFLKSTGLALAALGFAPGFLARALAATDGRRGRILVTIFQRGAVDGLSMVPPIAEGAYAAARPGIAIPPAGRGAALPLDGHFGLHPALASLKPLWDAGTLAVVHAAGSPDPTRSHFDAQDYLDAGTPGVKSTRDGWLNRALQASPAGTTAPFRAVALQPNLPRSLAGRAPALALGSLDAFGPGRARAGDPIGDCLARDYAASADPALRTTGAEAFEALRALREANPARFTPRPGADYPAVPIGQRLRQIAQLVKADVGLEAAATDCGGWDTHAGQGAWEGPLATRLKELGDALAAFSADLCERMADVCVVTMTEFGRTVRENGTRGTDHGHGSVMLVLGGGVKGRRVLARWKGLREQDLFEGRDLAVTMDHREVLGEVLRAHMGIPNLETVFPGFASSDDQRVRLF